MQGRNVRNAGVVHVVSRTTPVAVWVVVKGAVLRCHACQTSVKRIEHDEVQLVLMFSRPVEQSSIYGRLLELQDICHPGISI